MSTYPPEPAPAGTLPPVEHRLLGMDRRTFKLPLIVVAIALLWAVVMPAIDRSVDFDDPVRAGDAIVVAQGVSLTPPVGWGIQQGVRASSPVRNPVFSEERTLVTGDGIAVQTQAGSFAGDAAALLRQVEDNSRVVSSPGTFTAVGTPQTVTVGGRRGVVQEFKALDVSGATFAFAQDGRGLIVTVSGSTASLERGAGKIGRTIASLDFGTGSAGR